STATTEIYTLSLHDALPICSFAEHLIGAMFSLNLLLCTFNLLPVTPLDGSTAIMLFMSETRAQRYLDWLRGNSYGVLGLVAALLDRKSTRLNSSHVEISYAV